MPGIDSITIHYLEMLDPGELKSKYCQDPDFWIKECLVKQYPFNRFLYEFVGKHWHWIDKLYWSDETWREYVEDNDLRTWVAYKGGSPAGYYELQHQEEGNIEIMYLGLGPAFIGKGYGGHLVSHATQSAWEWGARRVWVHTCSLDHPNALANYQARGFKIYKKETKPDITNIL
jgi:ribosomal protein S18 acetylase RimI-like enzyme